tara:strand:- start:1266 stop:1460 length:195 start_codon:yes stop_codon:yes gene_type:complete
VLQITEQERANILAALNFWSEEIVPYGDDFARPHLEAVGCGEQVPLNNTEIEELMNRIRQSISR